MFSNVFASVSLALLLLNTANAQSCARNYTAVAGDNCDTIGAAQNVSTFQLRHVNSQINDDCTNIVSGEDICLGIMGQDCNTTAVVNSSDTCASIEATAGIDDATLKANNQNVNEDCSNIRPGEVLCTASEVFNYTDTP